MVATRTKKRRLATFGHRSVSVSSGVNISVMKISVIALGLLMAFSASGQLQESEHSVNGTVRDALTGEPVRNAVVTLWKMSSGNPPSSPPRTVAEKQVTATLSGQAGEFHFEGLPEGRYEYAALKPGFTQELQPAGTFVIPRTPADEAIVLQLRPQSRIEGKVVNQYDEPLENVVLHVYELQINGSCPKSVISVRRGAANARSSDR
ncbi:MAG TPA: carboxypeptidase-like regulatory domain-containing protein [Bryobacteraceae bacterium]|nr:carboxypeptidase-like regulatory domain-containing protein [Bryobacteraceae bacterium]